MNQNISDSISRAEELMAKRHFKEVIDELEAVTETTALDKCSEKDRVRYYILLGEAYWYSGNLLSSKGAFDKGLNVDVSNIPAGLAAELLNNSALLDKNLGYYETSEKKYLSSKELYEASNLGDSPHYVHVLNNLAILLKDMGRLSASETLFKKALKILSSENHFPEFFMMQITNNLASLYCEQGDYERSKALYFTSLTARVLRFGPYSRQYAESLNNLAVLYSAFNNDIALRILEKSYDICKTLFGVNDLRTAKTMKNLSLAVSKSGNNKYARELLMDSLKTIKEKTGGNAPLYWKSLKELAIVEWRLGNHDNAGNYFERTILFLSEQKDIYNKEYFTALFDYSRYLFANERVDEAFRYLKEAMESQNMYFENIVKGLPEDSAVKLIRKMAKDTGYFISALLKFHDHIELKDYYPLLYLRKGLVFEVTFLNRMEAAINRDPVLKEKFNEYKQARSEIARRLFTGTGANEDPEHFMNRQQKLLERCVDLERELLSLLPENTLENEDEAGLFTSFNKKTGKSDFVMDYYKYREYDFENHSYSNDYQYCVFYSFLRQSEMQVAIKQLGDSKRVEKTIRHYRKIISGEDGTRGSGHSRLSGINEIIAVCKQLYEILLPGDFINSIKESGSEFKKCYICPDGEISTVAFESLISPEDDFFLDDFCVNYSNSIREILRNENVQRTLNDITIFANPEYELNESEKNVSPTNEFEKRETGLLNLLREKTLNEGYYSQLKGTQEEGSIIKELFEDHDVDIAAYFTGDEAFKQNLKMVQSPSVVHLATHGFFISDDNEKIPHPLFRSGIVLSGVNSVLKGKIIPPKYEDGVFSAYDATTLSLDETQIVVLSACETGLGEIRNGEGILGLRRSFAQAGAKTIVMSLWRVSDKYTVFMMERFYKNILKGMEVPRALRNAQLELIEFLDETFGFASPSLWAGFICQGNPLPLTV